MPSFPISTSRPQRYGAAHSSSPPYPHMAFLSPPALMTWTWVCRRCVAVRTTISLNPSGKCRLWQARARAAQAAARTTGRDSANTSKKWSRNAPSNYKPLSSRSKSSYEPHSLKRFGAAIDLRDNETAGHSQRVWPLLRSRLLERWVSDKH